MIDFFFNRNIFRVNKYDPLKHSKSHRNRQCSLPQVRRTRGANTFPLRNQSPTLESLTRPVQPGVPSDPQQPGGDSFSTPLREPGSLSGRRVATCDGMTTPLGTVFFLKNIGLSFEYFDVIYLFQFV